MSNKINEEIEVVKSPNQSWAFTIKKLGSKDCTPDDYADIMDKFHKAGHISNHYYETDSLGKYHIHGTIELRKGFYRKMLCLQGFHVKLVEISNQSGWDRYIQKDQDKDWQNRYMFDD